MANVTVTDRMRDDARFDHAGVLLGIDGDLVRFKMIRLYSWQTENYSPDAPTYVVTRGNIVGRLGVAGPEALVEAELAEVRDGGFYIRGTVGAIEWLWGIRNGAHQGGLKRAEQAKSAGRVGGRFVKATGGAPADDQPVTSPTTSRSPAPPPAGHQPTTSIRDPGSGIWDPEESGERESGGPASPAALVLVPPEPLVTKPDPAAALAQVAVGAINAAAGRTFDARSAATLKLARALVKAGATHDDVRTVVAAKAAEWLPDPRMAARVCPGTLLAAENFARYLDEARAGPPAVVTPRQAATGRAPPTATESTERWDPRDITPRTL